ncbi:MAG: hypothetical protein DRP10_03180 [Candidatus Aenigmatarchaeota archaeon]|nr:MAG: hypothetical protein DRP10_03180 [Candidatus Aenigmarchaeota archaeon]
MKGTNLRKGIVNAKDLVYILLIPVMLIVMVLVFANFEITTPSAFYRGVTGEDVNLSTNGTWVSLSHCEQGLVNDTDYPVKVYNSTTTLVEDTNYEVDYTNCKVRLIDNSSFGVYDCDYYYKGQGYASYEKTADQSYNAFSIASIVPLVIIAVVVIGILLKAFVF